MDLSFTSALTGRVTAHARSLVAVLGSRGRIGGWVASAAMIYDESMFPDVHVADMERQARDEKEVNALLGRGS